MNREWIAFHLEEAKEQIDGTLRKLADPDYRETEFRLDVQHMLHHLHTAYNSRNVEVTGSISEAEFVAHRRPPKEIEWD